MAKEKPAIDADESPFLVPTVVMNKDGERVVVRTDDQKKWEADGWALGEPGKKGK